MTDDVDFFHFLEGALTALRAEVPQAYAGMCQNLRDITLRLEVDGSCRYLRTQERDHALSIECQTKIALEIVTNRAALVALLDNEMSLLDSVRNDDFSLRGSPRDLVRLEDALFGFVRGAARSPKVIALLSDYLKSDRELTSASKDVRVDFDRNQA